MLKNIFNDVSWDKLGQIGRQWQLESFSKKAPPTWESYWSREREYWGADDPDKSRVRRYFGEKKTEQNLLEKCKKDYDSYKEYLLYWIGLCKLGEIVQVIQLDPNVIALSKNWKGKFTDRTDLEIWLIEEKTFFRRHVQYSCEIYKFGTIVVDKGSIEEAMGEIVGNFRVSHQVGSNTDRRKNVIFNSMEETIKIRDALFRIVG